MTENVLEIFEEIAEKSGGESISNILFDLAHNGKYKNRTTGKYSLDFIPQDVIGQYDYEHIEQDGGGEGGAEDCYGVFKLNGVYYSVSYSYYSYNGYDYDYITSTVTIVHPVQRLVTFYE